MARISTYENGENISGEDKVLGTDADSQNQTKNFTVNGIADFALDKLIEPDATEGFIPVFGETGKTITDGFLKQSKTSGGLNQVTLTNADRFIIDKPLGETAGDPEYLITQSGSNKVSMGWDDDGDGFGYLYNWAGDGWRFGSAGNNPELSIVTTSGAEGVSIQNTLTVVNDANIGGNLLVTLDSTLEGTLTVGGSTELNDTLAVANATTLSGTLNVSNNTTLLGSLDVAGDTYLHRLKIAGSDAPFQEGIDLQVGNFDEAAEIRLIANVEFGNGNVPTTSDFYSDVTVQGDGGGSFTFKGTAPVFTVPQIFPQGVSAGHPSNALSNAAFIGGIGLTGNGDYSVILGRSNDETIDYTDVDEKTILQVGGGGGIGSKRNALTIVRTGNGPGSWEFNLVMEWLATQSDYSNDSEAGASGVPIGGLYRTGSDVKIRVN